MAKKSVADRFLSYMKRYHTGSEKAIKTDELAEIYKLYDQKDVTDSLLMTPSKSVTAIIGMKVREEA